ncbi:RNA polymerase sigma factor [Luteimonas yindakuii]|nr:sigma-70 family RNA polymerase sigma factor [Luteimonas yindakuii]
MPLSSHPLQAAGAPPVAMSPPPPPTSASGFAIDVPGALLQRARAGERAAFEQLYRWFERPTFTLALRICGDREAAADVLQDTMLKMIDRIGEFRGACPFWGWLRQIAVNEALMRLRRGRRFEGHLDVDEHELASDVPPPSAAADAAALQRALAGLPVITRSVLWLYHAEGFTHEEIGALMERTPSFSKSQVARGTRRLRELLETPSPASAGALP